MADSAATVLGNSRKGVFPHRFSTGTPFLRGTIVSGCTERQTSSRSTGGIAPHYLITPDLEPVQKIIQASANPEIPCRLLAGLNQVYPITQFLSCSDDPQTVLSTAFHAWMESFMSKRVLDRFDLALQILSANEVEDELFGEIPDAVAAIRFGFCQFERGWFPIGENLKNYEKQHPGLAKYILRMLSDCPLEFGTPENIYELVSGFCWDYNENETEIFEERYAEYLEMGESEEEARKSADETLLVDYAEFETSLPEWAFRRSEREDQYIGPIPSELKNLKRCHSEWRKRKQKNYLYPNCLLPAIAVSLDYESHDFCREVIGRIENELMQYGVDYYWSTLAWPVPVCNFRKLQTFFRELREVLEYFSACMDFLFMHEKECPDA